MPGQVIGKTLNYGFPGTVSHSPDTIIDAFTVTGDDIQFGDPVVLNDDGTISRFDSESNTAADFIGFAVRGVKQAFNLEGDAYYREGETAGVLTRGYLSVHIASGEPVQRGAVKIDGSDIVASGGVALTNAIFRTDQLDANGVTEVTILNRVV
ncbi:hypothetical protein FACS1894184_16390 [Clostridia bacterium]|nr:hypothetical protein FACS1894184_16390 [Clostridia bacterium]